MLREKKEEIVNNMTDDFDKLTKDVGIAKLKEFINKKNEENKKNAPNDKKN